MQVAYGGDVTVKDKFPDKKKILTLLNPHGGTG